MYEVDSKGETWDEDKCDTLPKGSPYFMERSTGWNAVVQSVPAGESAFLCLQCCNSIVMKPCTSKMANDEKCKQDEGVKRVLAVSVPNSSPSYRRRDAQHAVARLLWVRVQVHAETKEIEPWACLITTINK